MSQALKAGFFNSEITFSSLFLSVFVDCQRFLTTFSLKMIQLLQKNTKFTGKKSEKALKMWCLMKKSWILSDATMMFNDPTIADFRVN